MLKNKIEATANVVFIIIAVLLVGIFVSSRIASSHDTSLQEGEIIQPLSDYAWSDYDRTLVLYLSAGCKYCQDSAPFYRRLLELHRDSQSSTNVLAVFSDPVLDVQELLRQKQLDIEYRASVPPSQWKISATPTLLLVSSSGRVLKSWQGQLSSEGEEHVLEMIGITRPAQRVF